MIVMPDKHEGMYDNNFSKAHAVEAFIKQGKFMKMLKAFDELLL